MRISPTLSHRFHQWRVFIFIPFINVSSRGNERFHNLGCFGILDALVHKFKVTSIADNCKRQLGLLFLNSIAQIWLISYDFEIWLNILFAILLLLLRLIRHFNYIFNVCLCKYYNVYWAYL